LLHKFQNFAACDSIFLQPGGRLPPKLLRKSNFWGKANLMVLPLDKISRGN
jgi:hypothetical protein